MYNLFQRRVRISDFQAVDLECRLKPIDQDSVLWLATYLRPAQSAYMATPLVNLNARRHIGTVSRVMIISRSGRRLSV